MALSISKGQAKHLLHLVDAMSLLNLFVLGLLSPLVLSMPHQMKRQIPVDVTEASEVTNPIVIDTTESLMETTPIILDTTESLVETTPIIMDTTESLVETTPIITDTTESLVETDQPMMDTTELSASTVESMTEIIIVPDISNGTLEEDSNPVVVIIPIDIPIETASTTETSLSTAIPMRKKRSMLQDFIEIPANSIDSRQAEETDTVLTSFGEEDPATTDTDGLQDSETEDSQDLSTESAQTGEVEESQTENSEDSVSESTEIDESEILEPEDSQEITTEPSEESQDSNTELSATDESEVSETEDSQDLVTDTTEAEDSEAEDIEDPTSESSESETSESEDSQDFTSESIVTDESEKLENTSLNPIEPNEPSSEWISPLSNTSPITGIVAIPPLNTGNEGVVIIPLVNILPSQQKESEILDGITTVDETEHFDTGRGFNHHRDFNMGNPELTDKVNYEYLQMSENPNNLLMSPELSYFLEYLQNIIYELKVQENILSKEHINTNGDHIHIDIIENENLYDMEKFHEHPSSDNDFTNFKAIFGLIQKSPSREISGLSYEETKRM